MEKPNQPESINNTLQKINFEELQRTFTTIQTSYDNGEISIYSGGGLTMESVIKATEKILIAFPKIEKQMIGLLRERFKANGFNDERMNDSINFVIDNYSGFDKLPAIGDFVRYDKKVKTYTMTELQIKHKDSYYMGATYDPIRAEYSRIDVCGQMRLVKKEDVVRYKLPLWINRETNNG